ncbi:MAG: hypothetical protein CM15mP72_0050 [Pelagibacteraceae bacterium]|nr:MAG: hypothetical protein CM15mP72_0050 [Pelagibacteraceae bacterium]
MHLKPEDAECKKIWGKLQPIKKFSTLTPKRRKKVLKRDLGFGCPPENLWGKIGQQFSVSKGKKIGAQFWPKKLRKLKHPNLGQKLKIFWFFKIPIIKFLFFLLGF